MVSRVRLLVGTVWVGCWERMILFGALSRRWILAGFLAGFGAEPIGVAAANMAPVLGGAGGTLNYTEGDGAAIIDSSLTIADQDDTQIESATVTISSGLNTSEDALSLSGTHLSPTSKGSLTTPGVAFGIELSSDNNTAYVVDHTIPDQEQVAQWPATFIKWYGAHAFASFYGIDLPTEAQWEYAAQGGQGYEFPTDDGTLDASKANYNELNSHPDTGHVVPVKSYPPNPFGLYDMAGNVWEWCADWFDPDFYSNSPDPDQDPFNNALVLGTEEPIESPSFTGGPGQAYNGDTKVKRGGSWNFHAATLDSRARERDYTFRGNDHFGFRVVNNTATSTGSGELSAASTSYNLATLPTVHFVAIPSGSFVMGDDSATGPISDSFKPERTVNMSAFGMSEAEITNEQYVTFLNAALAAGLIEITDSDPAGTFVVGTSSSTYEGHKLIELSGSRVLKDHTGDGTIDPENPLNQCWIEYNAGTTTFSVKDPRAIDWDAFVFETGESRSDWPELADDTSGLEIIDVSNPVSPSLTGTYDTPGLAKSLALSPDGTRVCVVDDTSGLLVIDVSTPASPSLLGSLATPGEPMDVVLSQDGNTAFVADGPNGLQVIDISTAGSPSITGTLNTTGTALGLVLSSEGSKIYLADGVSGLQIINVSTLASPSLLGTFNTSGNALSVTLSMDGNTAFVADDTGGLQIVNVSNPTSPSLTGTYDTPGNAYSTRLSPDGKTAFVADRVGGLQIVNIMNPASPSLTGSFDTERFANDLTLSSNGKTAFVADYTGGLQVINLFISGLYTSGTGVLALSGAGTIAQYEAALEAVTYANSSDNPSTANRTISWVINDGDDNSTVVTSTISVSGENDPPSSVGDSIERGTSRVRVAIADLLSNDSDPENDSLSITAVGSALPAGASVRIVNDWIVYDALATTGAGSFEYTLSDGTVGVVGTVSVGLEDNREQSKNIMSVSDIGGGNFKISGLGIPGVTYKVQFTDSLTAPISWTDLGTATTDSSGKFEFTDPSGASSRFYRTLF